jgi:hypothetical protein
MRLLLLLLALSSCATARAPDVLFTSFGAADPAGDAEVVDTWKSDRALLIRNAREPDAVVKLKGGREVTIREFAKKRVEATVRVEVLVDDVKVLTQAAGGTVAVVSWLRASQTETEGVVGLVLKADSSALEPSKLKRGKLNEI